jgi:transcriptional regulator with XRE-family HTH domain
MANDLTSVSRYMSQNIAALRHSRQMSQLALAKLAEVPRSTVTYLESGQGNPSLQNLIRIAGALQVSIEELLNRPRPQCKLIKREEVPVQKRANGMATIFKLLPDPIPATEIDRMEIQAGGRMGGIPHTQNTKEYLVCISGQMEIHVSGDKYRVSPGDVLAFSGDQPHSYHNVGKGKAECLSVVVLAPHGV